MKQKLNLLFESLYDVTRDFVFGMEDGLVSNFALVLGVYFGGGSSTAILLAGLVSMFAGAFSMSAGSFLSAKSQREVYEYKIKSAEELLKKNPKGKIAEMKKILKKEGFNTDEIEVFIHHFAHHNHSTFAINYIQKKVGISKEKLEHPLKNASTMFISFLCGSLFPVFPFFFFTKSTGIIVAATLTIISLFIVGVVQTYYTKRNPFKSGFEVLGVGVCAGIIGYLIGLAFQLFA